MADVAEEFPGTERFSIVRRLGAGSFGVVYEAFDRKRNAAVALKTLRLADAALLTRFKREFRALTDLSHPNLVVLYELFSEGAGWFFTMELVHGVNLLDHVRVSGRSSSSVPSMASGETDIAEMSTIDIASVSDGVPSRGPAASSPSPASYDRVRDAFKQLAAALSALHTAKMVHRDVKPSNVMVNRQGRVVLLDFGLVASLGPADAWQSVNIVGTPSYMSPEQSAALPVTESSDWYSLGVMLYEALTGRLPFVGGIRDIIAAKQRQEPPPPRSFAREVPSDLNDLCCELLRLDPASRPEGQAIAARLGGSRPEPRSPRARKVTGRARLWGRESHLKALEDAFRGVQKGRSVSVFVCGRSGMGKSELVRRFLEDVELGDSRAVLLAGRCYERESVPYKAVDDLIDSLARHLATLPESAVDRLLPRHILALARLFPVLREVGAVNSARRRVDETPDSQELRRRAFGALRELLARIADYSPVVLSVDDVQWGDLDSGALIEELIRPPDAPAMLLLISYRSEEAEASPLMERLLRFRERMGTAIDARDVSVDELQPEEASAMALALMGESGPPASERAVSVARESGGNPFFIEELVRYQTEESDTGSPTTLDEMIWQRILRLEPSARRLLEIVSVAGQPIERAVAGDAARIEADDEAPIALLRMEKLVRMVGSELETYHDRIRETASAHLAPEYMRELHHRLALAWDKAPNADPETLALHFQNAGLADRAFHYSAEAAARSAEALAFDRAARLYRIALTLCPQTDAADTHSLRVALGDALANAGRGAEAARVYQAAATAAGASEAIDLERRAAEQLLFSGQIDEGREAARKVLARVRIRMPLTPRRALISLLFNRARLRLRGLKYRERTAASVSPEQLLRIDTCRSLALVLGLYDVITGTDFHARHLLLALRAGEPYRVARALAEELAFRALSGTRSHVNTAALKVTVQELAGRLDNPHVLGLSRLNIGVAAFLEGRFREGAELLGSAESIFRERCAGVICELDTSVVFWMFCMIHLGDWKSLSRRVPLLLKDAEERGDLYAAVAMRSRFSSLLCLVEDDADGARQEERAMQKHCTPGAFESPHYWTWLARTEIALYAGQHQEAWEEVERFWRTFARSLLPRVQTVSIESRQLRARCALALGRLDEAESEARSIEREGSDWGNAMATLIRAPLAVARGDRMSAIAAALAAQQYFDAAHIGHYAAAAQWRRGELIGGEQGRALKESASAQLAALQVRNPFRMTASLAPGPWN